MIGNWSVLRTFNRDIKLLLGTWGAMSFGYFGIQGVLLNLYLLRLGYGIEFIGLLIASGQMLWAVVALPAGAVGKKIGLQKAIALAHSLVAVAVVLLLLVEWLPKPLWTPWIFSCWLILWVGAALNTVNATPYMMMLAGPSERRHAFAAQSATIALMGFAGGTVAGLLPGLFALLLGTSLDGPAPYRASLWVAPIFYLVAVLLIAQAKPLQLEPETKRQSGTVAPMGLFILLGVIVFLQTAGEGGARAFFNIYLDTDLNVATAQIGAAMGFAQLLPVAASMATPWLLDKWGTERTLMITGLTLCLTLVVMGMVPHWLVAAICFSAIISLASISGTSRSLFSQELVAQRWRTTSSAILTIGLASGWAVMAAIGGPVVERVGFSGFFFVNAGLAFLSALILLGYIRRQGKRETA